MDDHAQGAALEMVDAPPDAREGVVALRVHGNSMWPAYREGDLVYYQKDCDFSEADCLNSECIVRLEDERTLLKIVTRGNKPGHFTLTSYNHPPLENVRLQWACKVQWIKRK